MRNDIRYSGIDIIGNVQWGTTFANSTDKSRFNGYSYSILKSGLENNELCIWIMSQFKEMGNAKETLKVGIPYLDFYLEKG